MKITDFKREQLSKAMQQYYDFKVMHPDCIIFFQLGDFYEMFFEDAIYTSDVINLTLTKKSAGLEEKVPMAGIPVSAVNEYVKKLLILNNKVAIVAQDDEVITGKLVKRHLKKIITPGSYVDDFENENNFIGCVYVSEKYEFAYSDVTTGECFKTEFSSSQEVVEEIKKLGIKEVLDLQNALHNYKDFFEDESVTHNTNLEDVSNSAADILLNYTKIILCDNVSHLSNFEHIDKKNNLLISVNAQQQLELIGSLSDNSTKHTLFEYLDNTCTPMGKRHLKSAILSPLKNVAAINERLDLVEKLSKSSFTHGDLKDCFNGIFDVQRVISKISDSSISPRDVKKLSFTLEKIPRIKQILSTIDYQFEFEEMYEYCKEKLLVIKKEAPKSHKDGDIFVMGYNGEIDRLRAIKENSNNLLLEFEEKEKLQTGIKNLKVKYNKIFGFFIEITNSFLQKVPENYKRKQTMANCERYVTEELKDIELEILNASSLLAQLETNLFNELRESLTSKVNQLRLLSKEIGYIDFICSLSFVVIRDKLTRPHFSNDDTFIVKDSFHPVVKMNVDKFVNNDIELDSDCDIALITGPNMAGKSTYMRQALICVIMAQMGCFVAAKNYCAKVFDKMYTRIGASDDLSRGLSTFMVEMQETAVALKNMTHDSILVFDELGRGTSTYDGIALAHAVIDFVAQKGVKTMFSTHYHELINLEQELCNLKNYHVNAVKTDVGLEFSHKVKRGSVEKSFGIEVAMMADLPNQVIKQAKMILGGFEEISSDKVYENNVCDQKLEEIMQLDINSMSPVEVVNFINNFQKNL